MKKNHGKNPSSARLPSNPSNPQPNPLRGWNRRTRGPDELLHFILRPHFPLLSRSLRLGKAKSISKKSLQSMEKRKPFSGLCMYIYIYIYLFIYLFIYNTYIIKKYIYIFLYLCITIIHAPFSRLWNHNGNTTSGFTPRDPYFLSLKLMVSFQITMTLFVSVTIALRKHPAFTADFFGSSEKDTRFDLGVHISIQMVPWDSFQLSLRLLHLFWFTFKRKLRSFDRSKILERWDQANKRKAFTIAASFTNSAEPRLVAVCNDLRQVGHAVSQCYSGEAEVDALKATKTWPF